MKEDCNKSETPFHSKCGTKIILYAAREGPPARKINRHDMVLECGLPA